MRDQEILGLYEAYKQVHSSYELTEEVQIAAQYFIEMGLNDEGVDILIEELGVEEFAEFVYDISEEYILTEARAGGAKIEPKLSSGKPVQGKPKAATLKSLRKQKAARKEAENKASEAKPSGLKASLKRQSAVAAAAKKQPKKKSALDHVAGAVLRGIDRHNKAMGGLKKMGAATRETAGKVKKAAGEFKKGFVGEETDLFDVILEYLVTEGYADTNQAALVIMANMSEEWRQDIMEGMTMKVFKANRQKNERRAASADAEKRGHVGKEWYNSGRKYSPDEAKRSRANLDDEERRTRHRSAVEPDNESDDNFSADKTKNPKKLRKQKAMGELGEGVDIFDTILEYLVAEGYADTNQNALVIMANMSEEWKQSIVEADSLAAFQARREKRRAAMKKKTGYEGHDYSKPPAQAAAEREERMRKFINKD